MINKRRAIIGILVCISLLIAFLLCLPHFAIAEKDASTDYTVFLARGTERFILGNGLNVILKRDSRIPTAAITLLINTGSATEGPYAGSGITHFIEHMMFKGTSNYTAIEMEKELKSLGVETRAYTSFDYTAFKLQVPAASLGQVLHLFTDMIGNPSFSEKEFEKEQKVILREIDMGEDDPKKHLHKLFWQTAYIRHPYRNPVIGYRNVFLNLQISDLKKYYNEFYIPNNMTLSIVGDIEPLRLIESIKQTFGTLKRKKFSWPVLPVEPQQISSREFLDNFNISRSRVIMGFHTVGLNSSDLYALDTLAIILGGGVTSRLYRDLHDNKAMVHAVSSYNYTPQYPGLFIISSVINEGASSIEVVGAIKDEIKRIEKLPPKENELDRAKAQVLSSYLFRLETQQDKADTLAISYAMTGDLDFSAKYVKGIEAVTIADITRVVEKYLTEQNMTTVMLLPESGKDKGVEITQPQENTQIKTVKKVLTNGLVVLITENPTLPVCAVAVTIKGGLRSETKERNGISSLMSSTMLKGSGRFKKDEIADLVESNGAGFSPYSGNNSLGFTMSFMSKDTKEMLDLLANVLLYPTFPQEELDIVKNDTLATIDVLNEDIFKRTNLLLRENLFKGHAYRFITIGNKEAISNISREDLVEHHKNFCVGKNTVISICGDVNAEEAFEVIRDEFKDMAEGEAFKIKAGALVPVKSQNKISEYMDKKQAVVMIGYRGASLYNSERYPLQVLSSLFSGAAGRLYTKIRQKEGLAYTLGTFGMTGLDTGAFIFYAATVPQNSKIVQKSMFSEIKQVCGGKITAEEISSAKRSLIVKHQLSLQNNVELALQMALDELYGFGFGYYMRYPELINSVTKKDLISIANKYFKTQKPTIVITAPER